MPRVIRIQTREPGGGPAIALPSVDAAAASARAAGSIGRTLAGGVADVADTLLEGAERRQRKADALTYVSELASSTERVGEGLAAADAELNRMALDPDFDEQAWLAERERRYREVYEPIITGLRSEEIRARRQGELEGILAADTGALVDRLRADRAERSIEQVVQEGLRFARSTPLGAMPDFVGAVNETLTRTTEQFPELAGKAQGARDRLLAGIRGSYLDRGALGDLQFWTDVRAGDLDALGEETLLGVRTEARDQSLGVADEILDRAIRDQPEGVLSDSGGLFPRLDFRPDLTDIDAAIEATNALPEEGRDEIQRSLRQARAALERQADLYQSVAYPFWNEGGRLGHLDEDGAVSGAVDDYFVKAVRPWLERPDVDMNAKVNLLVRSIRGIGYLTPAMAAWVDETMLSASASPTTKMAIAQALGSVGPEPLRSMRALTQGQELALQERGFRPVVLEDRPPEVQAIIDGLGRRSARTPEEAANALQGVLEDQAAGRGAGGARARSVGGPGGRDALQRVFAPNVTTEAEGRARAIQDEVVKGIRESFRAMGIDLEETEITPRMQSEIGLSLARHIEDAESRGRSADEAVSIAKGKAFAEFYAENPPVTLWQGTDHERTYLDGRLRETLQGTKYPARMIEMTIEEGLRERGYDVRPDLLARVRIYGGPFDLLADDEFKVEILPDRKGEGGEILDGMLRFDGSEYDRWKSEEALLGVEESYKLGRAAEHGDRMEELFRAATLDRDAFRRWSSAFPGVKVGAPLGPPPMEASVESRFLSSNGEPVFTLDPELKDAYDSAYRATLTRIRDRTAALRSRPPGASGRDFPAVPAGDPEGLADVAGKEAVIERLRLRFKGQEPTDVLEWIRTGGRAPDPALRPVRGAVP